MRETLSDRTEEVVIEAILPEVLLKVNNSIRNIPERKQSQEMTGCRVPLCEVPGGAKFLDHTIHQGHSLQWANREQGTVLLAPLIGGMGREPLSSLLELMEQTRN